MSDAADSAYPIAALTCCSISRPAASSTSLASVISTTVAWGRSFSLRKREALR